MRAILFRKLEIDGVNYYQLYDEIDDFEPSENEGDFTDFFHRGEKDYFYIDGDSDIEIPDPTFLNVYYDDNGQFINVQDNTLFMKVFNAFVDKYNIVVKEIKPIDDVVDDVSKKIMFQETAISNIVQRIYMNQSFVISDLPIELKQCQKTNILFHGTSGSGKKTIVKNLQNELSLPYAYITLNSKVKTILEEIIQSLLEKSSSPAEASCGVVYIKDNFEELANSFGDDGFEGVIRIINFLMSQGIVVYDDKEIDFRTVTFVILYDDDKHDIEFSEMQNLIGCDLEIATRDLTVEEKYHVLFSENGIIHHYEKFLNHYGCKFVIDEKCLMNLIEKCSQINPSMDAINKLINAIVSYSTYNSIVDVVIDDENMEVLNDIIDQIIGVKDDVDGKDLKDGQLRSYDGIENYLFDKDVDKVFNEARKYFIGQDKHLRLFITNVINNLRVAEKNDLYSPQSYKLNILIRGGTGTGKTFLVDTVCKLLKVPYVAVDASEYTESGYVGASISDIFVSLYRAAGNDLEKAQKGIIFLDEIDKKTDNSGDRSKSSTKAVLHELLKPAEGTIINLNVGTINNPNYISFDTSRVTFICAGAFEGIEKVRDSRVGKSKIGFGSSDGKKQNPEIIKDDYILYGMPAEFMGRVKSFIDLNDPTIESILDILKNSELSALKIAKYQFSLREINLEFTEGFCRKIAELSIERKEGVRGVGNILEEILQKINHQDIRASEVEEIVLTEEVIDDPQKVILVERGKQKKLKI